MQFTDNIFPFLLAAKNADERIAIATLVNVEGSSPRPLGSQIGVSENGEFVGMITGGCAEKAIVAEAVRCIEKHCNEVVRYGAGSPYLDVTLPCGSGIDIYIETKAADKIASVVGETLAKRQCISYFVDLEKQSSTVLKNREFQFSERNFAKSIEPDFRLLCFGEGANLSSICTIGAAAGFLVEAYSPDNATLELIAANGIPGHSIHNSFDYSGLNIDPYCGIVTMFHEHEWEPEILMAALNSDARYIGALGSNKTHELRLSTLQSLPKPKQPLSAILGPVGLDIGAQSPIEIGVSIIAEIIALRNRPQS